MKKPRTIEDLRALSRHLSESGVPAGFIVKVRSSFLLEKVAESVLFKSSFLSYGGLKVQIENCKYIIVHQADSENKELDDSIFNLDNYWICDDGNSVKVPNAITESLIAQEKAINTVKDKQWVEHTLDASKPLVVPSGPRYTATLNIESMKNFNEEIIDILKLRQYSIEDQMGAMTTCVDEDDYELIANRISDLIEKKMNEFIDQADGAIKKNIYETVKKDFLEFLSPTVNPNQTQLFDEDNG